MLPEVQAIENKDYIFQNFKGLNEKPFAGDEEFKSMANMTSDEFPYLAPRKPYLRRGISATCTDTLGLCVFADSVYSVQRTPILPYTVQLYKNFEPLDTPVYLSSSYSKRQMVRFGAYIAIFPDNILFNTEDETITPMDYSQGISNAYFYMSDKEGRFFYGLGNVTITDDIKTNDTALTQYITSRPNTILPVPQCKSFETVVYDDNTTSTIYPACFISSNKSRVEELANKTSYPVYLVTKTTGNTYTIEEYNADMSMWTPTDNYLTWYLETTYNASTFTDMDSAINEGDFVKLNGLKQVSNPTRYIEIEAKDTKDSFYKIISKYRERSKVVKKSTKSSSESYSAIGLTFQENDGSFLNAIRDKGLFKTYTNFLPYLGFALSSNTICDRCDISKDVPDMDFVTVCQNRIWGCSTENHEIYSCKTGDATNWYTYAGMANDSYAVTIADSDVFTGAITYNDSPHFFKENKVISIMGNKPKNFETQEYECNGVEIGAEDTLVQRNGYLYYKSKLGVERFNGNNSLNLTPNIDMSATKAFKAAVNDNKYYIGFNTYPYSNTAIYVYDIEKGMWHVEETVTDFNPFTLRNNIYSVFGANNNRIIVSKLTSNLKEETNVFDEFTGSSYDTVEWFVESGEFNAQTMNVKYIERVEFEMLIEEGSRLSIYIAYNDIDEWTPVFKSTNAHTKKVIKMPVRTKKCERLRYKIKGKGNVRIYSIQMQVEIGSDD